MAITKAKKEQVVEKLSQKMADSAVCVVVAYEQIPVSAMQELRRQARQESTSVSIAKNRLFKIALSKSDKFKDLDVDFLKGQNMMVFSDDEVAPTQLIAKFAKDFPQLQFVAAITSEGEILQADQLEAMSKLPSKEQLQGQLVGVLAAPLRGLASTLNGNISGLINVLNAKAKA